MNRSEILAYLGHHRSGSTWIYRVLRELGADILRREVVYATSVEQAREFCVGAAAAGRERFLCYVNADYRALSEHSLRAVHVVRDPRDLLVSAYFAHRFSHPTEQWPALAEFRRILESVDPATGLLLEIEFCANVFEDMRSFPSSAAGVLELRFESMIEDPWREFQRIFRHLRVDELVDEASLRGLVDRHAFENLSGGRTRGEVDPHQHYRAGVAGDWRQHFVPATAWAFEARFGLLLRRYGYESSSDWVDTVGAISSSAHAASS